MKYLVTKRMFSITLSFIVCFSVFFAFQALAVVGDAKCLKVNVPQQTSRDEQQSSKCYIMPNWQYEGRTVDCVLGAGNCYLITCDLQPSADKCSLGVN